MSKDTENAERAVTSRKTIVIKAIKKECFDFDEATVAVLLYTGGVVSMEFDGQVREGKGGRTAGFKTALSRLIAAIALEGATVSDYEVTDSDWVDVSNEPEYTAEKVHEKELTKLSKAVETAGAAMSKAGKTSRTSVLSIGAAYNKASLLLAVETGSPTDKPAKIAWGKWIERTPYAKGMFDQRRASISEYKRAAAMPDAIMDILPEDHNSAKAINQFNDKGWNAVAKWMAVEGADLETLSVVVVKDVPNVDMSGGKVWEVMDGMLKRYVSEGSEAVKEGVVYATQTDEQKEAEEPKKVNVKGEAHRLESIKGGVFAGVIIETLDGVSDAAFAVHKFGKLLAKHLRDIADAPSDAEKREEDTEDAVDTLESFFENLTAEQAAGHIATLCAKRLDVADVLDMAETIWAERYGPDGSDED